MKKALLFVAATATFGTASAQKMGDIFVYGSIGYTDQKQDVSSSAGSADVSHYRSFNFNPGVGYQIGTHLGVGLMADFNAAKNGTTDATTESSSQTFVGPFVRYTRNLSNMFFAFGQLDAGYIRTNTKTPTGVGTTKDELEGNGFGIRIMPAIGVNVTSRMALIGSFGNISYSRVTENPPTGGIDYTSSGLNASFGNNFTLGVQWNFGGGMRSRRSGAEPMSETRRMRDTNDDEEEAPRRRRRTNNNDNE
jgi:hypothetical protein